MSTTQAVTLTTTKTLTRPKQKQKQRRAQRQLFTPQQWRGRTNQQQPPPRTELQSANSKRPPQLTADETAPPLNTATPQYRRLQQLRQLRLLRRNKFKKQSRPAPPRPSIQHTAASPLTPRHIPANHPTFDLSISPISMHSPSTPCTPIIDTLRITNPTNLTNALVNEYLNETQPHMNVTPTIMYDHSDFLNETQTKKHMSYMNGKYTYTTHN